MFKLGLFSEDTDSKMVVLGIIVLGVLVLLALLLPNSFLTGRNFQSMGYQFPEFGILALAMSFAMITGGIDLSLIATANLAGIFAALVMKNAEAPEALVVTFGAVLVALVVATTCGLFNGLLVSRAGVPPILATLGTMIFYNGIGMAITSGVGITGFPRAFLEIGGGKIWIFPVPIVVFIIVAAVLGFVLKRTTFGVGLIMLGTNPVAGLFSGLNNSALLTRTYVITGFLAGLSSLLMASRFNSVKVGYGDTYLLQAVLVAVLGGTDPYGGYIKIWGVVMAIALVQFLQNAFTLFAFTPYAKGLIWGLMLVVVMMINYVTSKRQEQIKIQRMKEEKAQA